MLYEDLDDLCECFSSTGVDVNKRIKKESLSFFVVNPPLLVTYVLPYLTIGEIYRLCELYRGMYQAIKEKENDDDVEFVAILLHCSRDNTKMLHKIGSLFLKKNMLMGRYDAVNWLLRQNIILSDENVLGYITFFDFAITTLEQSIKRDNGDASKIIGIVKVLLRDSTVDVNRRDKGGFTLLYRLITYMQRVWGFSDQEIKTSLLIIFGLLLENPCLNINDIDDNGWTVLHHAAAWGCHEVVSILLQSVNVKSNLETDGGLRSFDIALKRFHTSVIWVFIDHDLQLLNSVDIDYFYKAEFIKHGLMLKGMAEEISKIRLSFSL